MVIQLFKWDLRFYFLFHVSCANFSAGVGRTGAFICIDYVLEQVKKENMVDIAGAINKMRHQRMLMVQTSVSSCTFI